MEPESWHVEKGIQVGTIFSLLVAVAGGVMAFESQSGDIQELTVLQSQLVSAVANAEDAQNRTNDRQDNTTAQFRTEMREDVNAIHVKLDRLIERLSEK